MTNSKDLDLGLELEPEKTECSYISTGLSEGDKDFPLLQDMRMILLENPEYTADQLLDEVGRQITADKLKRMKREARRHKRREEEDD